MRDGDGREIAKLSGRMPCRHGTLQRSGSRKFAVNISICWTSFGESSGDADSELKKRHGYPVPEDALEGAP